MLIKKKRKFPNMRLFYKLNVAAMNKLPRTRKFLPKLLFINDRIDLDIVIK